MSSATEIPDILGSITNATGLNRLWQSDQQTDGGKRKSQQEAEPSPTEPAVHQKHQGAGLPIHGSTAPVSIAKERETEEEEEEEEEDREAADHDAVPLQQKLGASPKKRTGYEWPMPASLKTDQAKKKLDSEPTKDDDAAPAEESPETTADGPASKSSFMGSLIPFLAQPQRESRPQDAEDATAPAQSPLDRQDTFSRPRLYSSSSQQPLERPTHRATRQHTVPVHLALAGDDTESGGHRSAARSRWISAAQGIRFPMRRKKTDKQVAATKGTEVMTSLLAAAPAATLVGTRLVPDERGHHRIPVIVDLLKIDIIDSEQGNRGHATYRINLTYGDGPTQMKWTIQREQRDFQALHNRLRLLYLGRRDKLPEFPYSGLPFWLGNFGGQTKENEKKDIKNKIPQQLGPGIAAGVGALAGAIGGGVPDMKKKDVQMMVRIKLQEYLMQLAYFLRARPGLNRLCKFLELSTLGIRLAGEHAYHGKEGWLVIASAKGSNAAIHCNPRLYKRRHSPKWFMVRHSYIVCVEELEGLNIYDVLLVDSDFDVQWHALPGIRRGIENGDKSKHHFFTISNAERTFKLGSESDKKMMQFIRSIQRMRESTLWSKPHRFDSFAPVRYHVQAQWLVDGRDYFWNVSRAILKARDVIYIHEYAGLGYCSTNGSWWLSPELHMRRPAANAQKWRLDRLLQRKAQEGVKIYVIIYQNVGTTVPIDSTHTKYSLLGLHPNIFVQRSPRHVGGLGAQNVFFWAHHEKIISIDGTVGFVGGLDLCYGRWDSPEHVLVDDKPSGFDEGLEGKTIQDPQVWPGKDYSNPRIHDFFELDKPYEDMYDRTQTPRMPWHDVSMQVTGQPARDLARHFIQRWNYLLRTKPPSKPTPLLLPPPEFTPAELESLNLNGTCELQILRSCGPWSMGLQDKTEQSIQNAYLKCIEQSEHFVYIENQFFITSCECDGTKIENAIGDALVNRIIRAHKGGTEWRAIILIPLMPGFQNTIDSPDGSSLRLIMYSQYYSLCRGETSIFGRLRQAGVEPEDYISVYGLRGWGKIGDQQQLVTEQVYIHAKIMIVDDRVAIIGSANINERSMRGNRDSEVAAIIRDTEQYEIMMAGKPFMVGKFAHTLRMRLQLEHLGVNTDDFEQRTMMMDGLARAPTHKITSWDQKPPVKTNESRGQSPELPSSRPQSPKSDSKPAAEKEQRNGPFSFNHDFSPSDEDNYHINENVSSGDDEDDPTKEDHPWQDKLHLNRSLTSSPDRTDREKLGRPIVTTSADPLAGAIPANMQGSATAPLDRAEELEQGKRDPDVVRGSISTGATSDETLSESPTESPKENHLKLGNIPKPGVHHGDGTNVVPPLPQISRVSDRPIPIVDPYNFVDPLSETFFYDEWDAVAHHNTEVYRRVFRPMPDNEVKTWTDYKESFAYGERLAKAQGGEHGKMREQTQQSGASGPVGAVTTGKVLKVAGKKEADSRDGIKEYTKGGKHIEKAEEERIKEDLKATGKELGHGKKEIQDEVKSGEKEVEGEAKKIAHEAKEEVLDHKASHGSTENDSGGTVAARRRRGQSKSTRAGQFSILPRETMEELLCEVQGHLVVWPMDWLAKEDANGNFLYNIDKVQPMEIYD